MYLSALQVHFTFYNEKKITSKLLYVIITDKTFRSTSVCKLRYIFNIKDERQSTLKNITSNVLQMPFEIRKY